MISILQTALVDKIESYGGARCGTELRPIQCQHQKKVPNKTLNKQPKRFKNIIQSAVSVNQ